MSLFVAQNRYYVQISGQEPTHLTEYLETIHIQQSPELDRYIAICTMQMCYLHMLQLECAIRELETHLGCIKFWHGTFFPTDFAPCSPVMDILCFETD